MAAMIPIARVERTRTVHSLLDESTDESDYNRFCWPAPLHASRPRYRRGGIELNFGLDGLQAFTCGSA